MEEVIKVHVGLDVHKDSIAVGVAEAWASSGAGGRQDGA